MRAKSINGNTAGEIKNALEKSMIDGFAPTMAVVFISIKQDRRAVCELLNKKGIDVIGATSSGEFINGHQSEGEAAIMLFDINRNDYCILFEDIGERTLNEAATNMAKIALQKFNKPAFILYSTLMSPSGKG